MKTDQTARIVQSCRTEMLCLGLFISSPEHEVLMVSYCGQSMSVVRRPSCVVRRQQLL